MAPRIAVLFKFDPDDLTLIDEVRGLVTRQAFVVGAAVALAKRAQDRPIEERARPVEAIEPAPKPPVTRKPKAPAPEPEGEFAPVTRHRPDDATLKAMPAWQRKQFGWD